MKKTVELIAEERATQIKTGFTADHDDEHDRCELIDAANCYANSAALVAVGGCGWDDCPDRWPWEEDSWRPRDAITSLVKAGALIVAEIDRLRRLGGEPGVKCPQLTQSELHEALGKLVDRIEACGASPELTEAVTLAHDIRQAVGNQWNPASEHASDRVRAVSGENSEP